MEYSQPDKGRSSLQPTESIGIQGISLRALWLVFFCILLRFLRVYLILFYGVNIYFVFIALVFYLACIFIAL
jgi:hypothetical protein